MPLSFNCSALVNTTPHTIKATSDELANMRLAVKDLFHIQGIPTAAGNPDWLATQALPYTTNSAVLTLLKQGADYIGKSVTDELAYSLNGHNVHYPNLLNPVSEDRLLGGSSSGSAYAVAAGLADIGLGTDTGGSIRVPASYNGLFGLRTSHGEIATDNMVALAPSFDTVGWMCANIQDMIKTAEALVLGKGSQQQQTPSPIKILALTDLIDKTEHSDHIYEWLQKHAVTDLIVAKVDFADANIHDMNVSETFRILQGYEIWQQHGRWIEDRSPTFARDIAERFIWCKSISAKQYEQALAAQQLFIQYFLEKIKHYDAVILPTTPGRAPLLSASSASMAAYRNELMEYTAIAGLTGLPQLHLPLFSIDGAKCGLSMMGKKGTDLMLLKYASAMLDENIS